MTMKEVAPDVKRHHILPRTSIAEAQQGSAAASSAIYPQPPVIHSNETSGFVSTVPSSDAKAPSHATFVDSPKGGIRARRSTISATDGHVPFTQRLHCTELSSATAKPKAAKTRLCGIWHRCMLICLSLGCARNIMSHGHTSAKQSR